MLNVDTMGISWDILCSIHSYAIFLTVLSQNVLQPFASPTYFQLADVSNHPAKDGVYR